MIRLRVGAARCLRRAQSRGIAISHKRRRDLLLSHPRVVFFLAARPEHEEMFHGQSARIAFVWEGQISVQRHVCNQSLDHEATFSSGLAIFGSQGRLGPTRRSYSSSHSFTTP